MVRTLSRFQSTSAVCGWVNQKEDQLVIAAGVALGIATFLIVYIIFAIAGRVFLNYSTEADKQGKPGKGLFLNLLAIVSIVTAFAGGTGAGILVALSIIGV